MRWSIGVVLVAILALGLVRLLFVSRPSAKIGVATGDKVAICLGPGKDVAANTAVTLLPLPSDPDTKTIKPAAVDTLDFATTGPVQVELTDAKGREEIQAGRVFQPTTAQKLTVSRGKGEFEFILRKATMIMHAADGQFLLRTEKPLRFGPADRTPYPVEITETKDLKIEAKDEGGKKVAVLPAGTKGSLDIGVGQPLVAVQPVPVSLWLHDTTPTLLPLRAVGQQGLSDLTIEARQPGLRFDNPGFSLTACALSPIDPNWKRVGVAETKSQGAGAANVRLAIPSDILPVFPSLDNHLAGFFERH